jgi:hypothetical protein
MASKGSRSGEFKHKFAGSELVRDLAAPTVASLDRRWLIPCRDSETVRAPG